MTTLKYGNLKQNKCPKCNDYLMWNKDEELLMCDCGFFIDEEEYTARLKSLDMLEIQKEFIDELPEHSEEETLSFLNNFESWEKYQQQTKKKQN